MAGQKNQVDRMRRAIRIGLAYAEGDNPTASEVKRLICKHAPDYKQYTEMKSFNQQLMRVRLQVPEDVLIAALARTLYQREERKPKELLQRAIARLQTSAV